MDKMTRKPKMGLLLIGSPRFKALGEGTHNGTYQERKEVEAKRIIIACESIADVVYSGVVYDRDQLEQSINQFFIQKVDFILAFYLSWAEDFAWIRFLRDIYKVPILFACIVRENCKFNDTSDENEFVEFLSAGNLVGTLEASGSLTRFEKEMTCTAIGSFDFIVERAAVFGNACKVRNLLQNEFFGLLANYNEVMWSTYTDPYNLFKSVGPELRFLSVAVLVDEIKKITYEEALVVTNNIISNYQMHPDVDQEKLIESVRASMALETYARKNKIRLVILNDVDETLFRYVGLRPGFSPTPGNTDVLVVPEGDIGAGLAVYVLKAMSEKHVNMIEPFYIDQKDGTFAAGHAGPNDYTDPEGKTIIARDIRFAKTSYKYAGAPFAWYKIPPGEKTMLHISECDGKYKVVCSLIDALETEHFLASYSHGIFKPKIPVNDFFEKLIHIGVTQHYAVVEGNYIFQLKDFAHIMGFDFHFIG